ncbi:neuroligin-4, X-linked-like isoform X2 [Artemia franciscana]|uniref:neuroligin-4, X-linked-like isoform X2 n=1 Tax=Artemia franciscana TaxID=6661 RepID=UPI0032DA3F92
MKIEVVFVWFLYADGFAQLTGRTVKTKYGLVKGVLVVPPNKDLQPVEAFLGIPYASPPVGPLRFAPSVPPTAWNGVRNMDRFGPACPQVLPDISNEEEALKSVSKGRLSYFKRLLKYLRSQSEDCLYLNIYSPITVGSVDRAIKFPIIVFLHGESFNWGSGNPYDGSILSSYGDVVVVTLNYRLGILGLFQRVILMSGTSFSTEALAKNPRKQTIETSRTVNCPVSDIGDDTLVCLKFKRVTEIMKVQLYGPLYTTVLGPVVDGATVPSSIHDSMGAYNELFSRYDVMYGVTQAESLHGFNEATLADGLTEEDRNRAVRTFVRNVFESNIDAISAAIINEYTNWKSLTYDTKIFRDSLIDIISDAQTVCPMINLADIHSSLRAKSYFYVFAYQSTYGDYPKTWGSVRGEELAYVFGMPLIGGTNHLANNYTKPEMLLSEMMMTYWTNFARTGNPNHPPKQKFISLSTRDRQQFDPSHVTWPTYDRISRRHLHIDLRPQVRDHYKAEKVGLWSKLIPELLHSPQQDFPMFFPRAENEEVLLPEEEKILNRPINSDISSENVPDMTEETPEDSTVTNQHSELATESTVSVSQTVIIIAVIGSSLLILNICACIGIFYQQDKAKLRERLLNRNIFLRPVREGIGTDKSNQRSPRGISTSTLDAHSKVRDWIATRSVDAISDKNSEDADKVLTIRRVKRNSSAIKCDVAVGEELDSVVESRKLILPKVLPDLPQIKNDSGQEYVIIPQVENSKAIIEPDHNMHSNQNIVSSLRSPHSKKFNRLSTFEPLPNIETSASSVPTGTPLFCDLQRHEHVLPIDSVTVDPPCPIHGYVDIYKGAPEPLYATVKKDRRKPIPPPRVPSIDHKLYEHQSVEPAMIVRPGVRRVPKGVPEKPIIRMSDPPLASSEDSGSDVVPNSKVPKYKADKYPQIQNWYAHYGNVTSEPDVNTNSSEDKPGKSTEYL